MGIRDFLRKTIGIEGSSARPEPEPPNGALVELLDTYRGEIHDFDWSSTVTDYASAKRMLELDAPDQVECLLLASAALADVSGDDWREALGLQKLVDRLMSRKGSLDGAQVEELCRSFAGMRATEGPPFGRLAKVIERHLAENAMTPGLERDLRVLSRRFHEVQAAPGQKLARRFDRILDSSRSDELVVERGDAWADALADKLDQASDSSREPWSALCAHARTATGAKASARWQKKAEPLVSAVGVDDYTSTITEILHRVGRVGSRSEPVRRGWSTLEPTMIDDQQADLLRGLIWASSHGDGHELYVALGQAAEQAYKKLPNVGPRSPKIGNACVHVLSLAEDPDAVVQLSRLKTRVKHASVKKSIDAALQRAADRLGITTEDLEEQSAPDFGMQTLGVHRRPVGDYEAEIRVTDSTSAELGWIQPGGRRQKSVPKAVKEEHGEVVAELKRTTKEITQTLPAIRSRLERLMVTRRSWPLPVWRERFLDHCLVGVLARRLIWDFERGDGERKEAVWTSEGPVGPDGQPVVGVDDEARVSLWHPIGVEPERVLRWRQWLHAQEVSQPFKQAHREVYLVTDAEIETGTFSNRFAAHVLRQHQFNALARTRGWRYTLQGAWDSHNTPFLELPEWELTAQFWVEGIGDYGEDTSGAGIFLYASTDQVRFYRSRAAAAEELSWGGVPAGAHPLPLAEVPALAFSEVMRDVDLFVSVCSVGNDPTWEARGEHDRYYGYWRTFSFGALGETATTRKQVLESLVPRLKIAERCSFSDKYLVVRGDLRTYKIHLGSGNILMEPNDQYLCIVPDRRPRPSDSVFLPFEGDGTLDVILSKALMLADDDAIQDPLIQSQIRRS